MTTLRDLIEIAKEHDGDKVDYLPPLSGLYWDEEKANCSPCKSPVHTFVPTKEKVLDALPKRQR